MSLVLGYWGVRGRAQPIRFFLEYVGLPYEDRRYTNPQDWFAKDKLAFGDKPLVNIPYIKDGECAIFESLALPIFVAHRANKPELLGVGAQEQVNVAQAISLYADTFAAFAKGLFFAPKADYEANSKQLFQDKVLPVFKNIEAFLAGKQFAAGKNVTYADFFLFEVEDELRIYSEETFNSFPNIKAHFAAVAELAPIKAYRSSNRFQERPFLPTHSANWG